MAMCAVRADEAGASRADGTSQMGPVEDTGEAIKEDPVYSEVAGSLQLETPEDTEKVTGFPASILRCATSTHRRELCEPCLPSRIDAGSTTHSQL
jgi:hypothetical protein